MQRTTAQGPSAAADTRAPFPNLVGEVVGGYKVLGILGGGATGVVYLAANPALGCRAALKILRREFTASAALAQEFADEARAIVELHHPHVVEVFDFVTLADGLLCVVMEYVDGRTLEQVATDAPMAPERAVGLLQQVADGLGAAHARGLVHRDLKAGNVMVVADAAGREVAKVLDLGAAHLRRPFGGTRPDGTVVGTPHYMSPEQVRGQAVDARTDIYALGVLAFRLLSGRVPYDGDVAQVLRQQVEAPLPALGVVVPAVMAVLRRATAKRPGERFGSAAEFMRELKAAQLVPAPSPAVDGPGSRVFRESYDGTILRVRFRSVAALREALASELPNRRLFVGGQPPPSGVALAVELQLPDRRSWAATAHVLRLLDVEECASAGILQGFVLGFEPHPGGLPGALPAVPPPPVAAAAPPVRPTEAPTQARSRRHRARIPAGCRLDRGTEPGFTSDVSSRGLCVVERTRRERGSLLVLTLTLPNGRAAEIETFVAWSSVAPGKPGFFRSGLKIIKGQDNYFTFLQELATTRPSGE